MGRRDMLTPTPGFFEAFYGGPLYPDCNLTLKLTGIHVVRAIEHSMKKREAATRG